MKQLLLPPEPEQDNFHLAMEMFAQAVIQAQRVTYYQVKREDCSYIMGFELNPAYWTTDFCGEHVRNVPLSTPTIMLPNQSRAMALDPNKLIFCSVYWKNEETHVTEEGIIPIELIQGLVYKWEEKANQLGFMWYDYDRKTGKARTDRKGNLKYKPMWWSPFDFLNKEHIHVSLRRTEAFPELWVTSGVNHPWIIADAFLMITGRYLPGSISRDERVPVRFYY